jgi:sec-independent protein translocase protein TatB
MFEVGFTELLLIFALALLVLGPQKLPKLAQQVGRWVGRARAMARQFRDQLEEEAHNFETKVSIDPGIDTSLDAKPKDTPATAPAPETTPHKDVPFEEEFYPPDHHMHPGNRAAADAAPSGEAVVASELAASGVAPSDDARQGEFDLTNKPDTPKASG